MTNQLIVVRDASYTYDQDTEDALVAVRNLNFSVAEGEHLAILGRNGSGKSTLARLLNALLLPQTGSVEVMGLDTRDEDAVWEIRSKLGMVFQNPDNQIVATTVEEDVAFGPENLGVPQAELRQLVTDVLHMVGMDGMEKRQPSELSGGQKQKLAVAGILAMSPRCIILDEATSMLDPRSRHELMTLVSDLCRTRGLTLINVTHHMDEVLEADRVLVMSHGELVMQGTPNEIFFEHEKISRLGLDVPAYIHITKALAKATSNPCTREDLESEDTAVRYLKRILRESRGETHEDARGETRGETYGEATADSETDASEPGASERPTRLRNEDVNADYNASPIIDVDHLSHSYNVNRPDQMDAITDISFKVWPGEFLGIAGHTGSGKSTLIQHLNGLIRPQSGTIKVMGFDVSENKDIRELRRHVGMVFQYPEQQLFAETIFDDVAYGPKHLGMSDEEVRENCLKALSLVGLDDVNLDRSPFELSGGQMRRVAIAGILAMRPEVLILDEPAAGLDPQGRDEIFQTILGLQQQGVTILLVSHSMDDLAKLADRIMILREGNLARIGTVEEIFADEELILANDLEIPAVMRFAGRFTDEYPNLDPRVFTPEDCEERLLEAAREAAREDAEEDPGEVSEEVSEDIAGEVPEDVSEEVSEEVERP